MLKFLVDETILRIKVLGKLEKEDFDDEITKSVDHIISEYGKIRGILIDASEFEGWEDFPALLEHIGFIQELDDAVYRVAILGDSTWQKLITPIADLFVEPVVKHFDPGQEDEAREWILAW